MEIYFSSLHPIDYTMVTRWRSTSPLNINIHYITLRWRGGAGYQYLAVFWFDLDLMTSQKVRLQNNSTWQACFCLQNQLNQAIIWLVVDAWVRVIFWGRSLCDVIESKWNQNTNESMTLVVIVKFLILIVGQSKIKTAIVSSFHEVNSFMVCEES